MQQDKENFGKIAAQTYIEKGQTRVLSFRKKKVGKENLICAFGASERGG